MGKYKLQYCISVLEGIGEGVFEEVPRPCQVLYHHRTLQLFFQIPFEASSASSAPALYSLVRQESTSAKRTRNWFLHVESLQGLYHPPLLRLWAYELDGPEKLSPAFLGAMT